MHLKSKYLRVAFLLSLSLMFININDNDNKNNIVSDFKKFGNRGVGPYLNRRVVCLWGDPVNDTQMLPGGD